MQKINLNELSHCVAENIEKVLQNLGVQDYTVYNDRISMPCPVHCGDNEEGASVFIDGIPNWMCWTHHCEEEIVPDIKGDRPLGKDVFGFIRGVLSANQGRHVEYKEAIEWSSKVVEFVPGEHEEDLDIVLSGNLELINKRRTPQNTGINREKVRAKLKIPSKYFLGRGFKEDTLDKYDVGVCDEQGKEMYHRVVVPFYDDNYKFMVGCTGRTLQPLCDKCRKYHYENRSCPQNKIEKKWAQKWINNSGFSKHNHLYNYWFARKSIEETGLAILVEGQPDVWRLEEAGFNMGICISGSSLTDEQKSILDSSGVMNLIVLTDNDEAGIKARKKIINKCKRYYNCYFLDLPKKDIGDMNVEEVKDLLGDLVEKLI